MNINKSHIIKLYPTKLQKIFFRKSCGTARFAFNWALNRWNEMYKSGDKPSAYTLIKELNSIKYTQFTWMAEVGKCAPQYAIHNLEKAFKNFFRKNSKYPKFKKKGIKDGFVAVENFNSFKQENNKIKIPRLGWVRCAENLRFEGKVNNVVIKRVADMWFAVVNIEIVSNEIPIASENQVVVGVDLGIKYLAVCSDGQVFENPKALKLKLESLQRQQRKLSRKVRGSNNRYKQRMRVAKLYYKVSCLRKDALHFATKSIVDSSDVIVLEDLNVKGMVKNHKLAMAISDVSLSEFRRQIEYKAKWQGKKVVIADRWFPSSKMDHKSGKINHELTLKDRVIHHEDGTKTDRDLNAAINLERYYTGEVSEINAFGDGEFHAKKQVAVGEEGSKLNFTTLLIIGLWLMLLAKLSYGQVINPESYDGDQISIHGKRINYNLEIDSIEVNQIGFILDQRYAIFKEEKDSIGHWTFEIRKDTLWFNENEPIALPGNYEKVIYRKIWKGKCN